MDTTVSFGPHIRAVASKAQLAATALSKILPNIGGPNKAKRRTLAAVVESIMLYAAPIWAGLMRATSYRNVLQSVHRKLALRVCRGYRTMSHDATMAIASMVHIHLLADERRRLYKLGGHTEAQKNEKRTKTLNAWQTEWEQNTKGRWTWRLIPDITPWVTRNHGEVGYLLTQWLSGHGSFKTYKKRISKTDAEECPTCGEIDTAEHAVFECPAWGRLREEAATRVENEIVVENVIIIRLSSRDNWDAIADMITSIMAAKEIEDRRRT